MIRYLALRLLTMIPTLIAISFLTFAIIKLPPGDYLDTLQEQLRSEGAEAASQVERLREEFHLDEPFLVQYALWAGGLVTGDLGQSLSYEGTPVADLLGERFLMTLILNLGTILFVWIVSFPIAMYSATHQYSWGDHGLSFIGFLGLATPNFLLALVLLYVSNIYFGTGMGGLMAPDYVNEPWSWGKFTSVLAHMWVPVVVIGTSGTAAMIRRLRANLLDELNKPYVVTARAKGVPPLRALVRYPLRVSLNPFIADIGNLLPQLVSGAAIVSVVMSLPTVGPLLVEALQVEDMYLAGSILMVLVLLTLVGILISDVLLAVLDPRIRLGRAEGA